MILDDIIALQDKEGVCYEMSTKSFQTEFVFTQKSGKNLAKALSSAPNKNEHLKISKPVKFVNRNDKKTIESILKDFT